MLGFYHYYRACCALCSIMQYRVLCANVVICTVSVIDTILCWNGDLIWGKLTTHDRKLHIYTVFHVSNIEFVILSYICKILQFILYIDKFVPLRIHPCCHARYVIVSFL